MKKTILILATVSISLTATSQDFFHKLGAGFSAFGQKYAFTTDVLDSEGEIGDGAPNVIYQAGLNFEIGNNLNIAPTAYPSLGFGINQVSAGGTSRSSYLTFQLPVLAELYIGDREEFGGFVGLGFSYSWYNVATEYAASFVGGTSTVGVSVFGPQVSAGIHFSIEGDNLFTRSIVAMIGEGGITLRGSYTLPVNSPKEIEGAVYTVNEYTYNAAVSILWDLGR